MIAELMRSVDYANAADAVNDDSCADTRDDTQDMTQEEYDDTISTN